jgi:glucan-binding YG repeat protein
MKPVIVGALLLLFGVTVPAFAQEEHQEESAKPAAKQEEARPAKQEEARPAKQEEARPAKQEEAKPAKQEQAKPVEKQQQAVSPHTQQAQGQYAKSGQKDSRGHEYNTSRFGPDHHARFVATGGRLYNGRREYSYGGYWFYAGAYPAWFYQQDVYFIMGADGLWYAVAYGNPSLIFQVNIE